MLAVRRDTLILLRTRMPRMPPRAEARARARNSARDARCQQPACCANDDVLMARMRVTLRHVVAALIFYHACYASFNNIRRHVSILRSDTLTAPPFYFRAMLERMLMPRCRAIEMRVHTAERGAVALPRFALLTLSRLSLSAACCCCQPLPLALRCHIRCADTPDFDVCHFRHCYFTPIPALMSMLLFRHRCHATLCRLISR